MLKYTFNFKVLLQYIKALRFEFRPDYDSLINILEDCLEELNCK